MKMKNSGKVKRDRTPSSSAVSMVLTLKQSIYRSIKFEKEVFSL